MKNWSDLDRHILKSHSSKYPCAVIHRSFPHNNKFVDLVRMTKIAREERFEPHVIILVRFLTAVLDSQKVRKHVPNEKKGRSNTKRAYLEIFRDITLAELPYTIVVYEFLKDPEYIEWIFKELGIRYTKDKVPEFKEANEKHIHVHEAKQ